jgi:hypothetical protein
MYILRAKNISEMRMYVGSILELQLCDRISRLDKRSPLRSHLSVRMSGGELKSNASSLL